METRDSLLAHNLSVGTYVDGELIVNYLPTFIMWSEEPECSTAGIGNWVVMEDTKVKTISLVIKAIDSSSSVVRQWDESLKIESGKCKLYEIKW